MFNEDHERSIVHVRKSMLKLPRGRCQALVPTEEAVGMLLDAASLQEFSDPTYEYLFIPLKTDIDFFVVEAGRAPQRYSSPYTNFPRITSSANPFFVMLAVSSQINISLTIHWIRSNLPQKFILSCFPEDLVSDNGDESDSDGLLTPLNPETDEQGRKPASSESHRLDDLSPPADKELLISNWVRHDADPKRLSPPVTEFHSPWPPSAPKEKPRPAIDAVYCEPSWFTDSEQGKILVDRYFYPLPE
ncbi:hypothetical protein C8J56DRAFT_1167039 [Mycena floridula]|nr:hypothetical protein C8J56DRAFT_1167039 [Mycena floridula]